MKGHNQLLLQMKEWKGGERQTWQQIPKTGPVVFPDAVEHHSPGRHVHSHCKCLGGEQHLGDEGEMQRYRLNRPWANTSLQITLEFTDE